jgi:hypothetical protein
MSLPRDIQSVAIRDNIRRYATQYDSRGSQFSGNQRGCHRFAGVDTLTANVRADLAMLHRCMAAAFVRAGLADLDAGLELGLQRGRIAMAGPGEQLRRDPTDIRTIQVEPNAAHELLNVLLLAEARIRANGTRLRTGGAGFDAVTRCVAVGAGRVRMSVQHALQ